MILSSPRASPRHIIQVTRGICTAFCMTFFSFFNIPVFWPILVILHIIFTVVCAYVCVCLFSCVCLCVVCAYMSLILYVCVSFHCPYSSL